MHEIIQDIFKIFAEHYHKVGDYSATELISPPRVVTLKQRYPECSKEISMIKSGAALIGTGVHYYIEHLLKPYASKYKLEERMTTEIMGKILSGAYDILVDDKHMYDVKTCKTWKLIFEPDMKDWIEQQNIYAWLMNESGRKVESLSVVAVYLDWKVGDALRSSKYPQEPFIVYPLKLWSMEETEQFINEKLGELIRCEDVEDDDLPACTREERWEKFPEGVTKKYAVMKTKDSKRAMRVLLSKEDAVAYCKTSKNLTSASQIEVRYAQRRRCDNYCDVNMKCNHYLSYLDSVKHGTLNDIVPMDIVLQGRWI